MNRVFMPFLQCKMAQHQMTGSRQDTPLGIRRKLLCRLLGLQIEVIYPIISVPPFSFCAISRIPQIPQFTMLSTPSWV